MLHLVAAPAVGFDVTSPTRSQMYGDGAKATDEVHPQLVVGRTHMHAHYNAIICPDLQMHKSAVGLPLQMHLSAVGLPLIPHCGDTHSSQDNCCALCGKDPSCTSWVFASTTPAPEEAAVGDVPGANCWPLSVCDSAPA